MHRRSHVSAVMTCDRDLPNPKTECASYFACFILAASENHYQGLYGEHCPGFPFILVNNENGECVGSKHESQTT